ncbi:LOW QUALITY PROTEIN: vitellogenin-1-like [Boleophthalmus pectinirostris]|uniref:LOW QUALITY PROTEIN: vitellogenin-1-like n=1 Tax=Boleophthalmus pectinirostris TaxID=150288 RepID=UPI00242F3651|nr:LOW QUALITY PROTEIN: vitellogenin-1-like [Boleophthalmus pectinirostris]
MRVVVLALALALVAGQHDNLAPSFAPGLTYVYKYNAQSLGGLSEQHLAKAGLNFTSNVKISVAQENVLMLQLENPRIYEFSGVWPKDSYVQTHLRADLEAHLKTAIKFKYDHGIVREILAPESVPILLLNIFRGILNFFQLNIKKSQNVYELQEEGAQGVCKTQYAITENDKAERILLTKSRNLNHCQEKVMRDIGLAYTKTWHKCQEISKNLRGTTGYFYKLKAAPGGLIIEKASGKEVFIQFTPFNDQNGAASMQTIQTLDFIAAIKAPIVPISAPYHPRGSLKYQFSTELLQSPLRILKMSDVKEQVADVLNNLVVNNRDKVHEDAPLKFFELILLLRASDLTELRNLLTTYKSRPLERRWLMDAISNTGTKAALEIVMAEIQKRELSVPEAAQVLIGTLHMLKPTDEIIQKVWSYIEQLSQEQGRYEQVVRKALFLGYGSIIHRQSVQRAEWNDRDIQRIQSDFERAFAEKNTQELVLLAKVMANAAQPWGYKPITKLLPIHGTAGEQLSQSVHIEAILALRGIAKQKPKEVQNLALQLFMDTTLQPEQRMLAVMTLFETNPSMAVMTNVINVVKSDNSQPVISFTYSLIKSQSRSTANPSVAAEANIALRLLGQRRQSMKLSKAFKADFYSHPLMLGAAASIYYINEAATILPKAVIAKTSAYVAGAAADVFEIGVRSEGFQEYFLKKESSDVSDRTTKMQRIIKAFTNWKSLPISKLLGSVNVKVLGQEIAFVDIDKQLIEEAMRIRSEIDIKEYGLNLLRHLFQNGVSAHLVKAVMPAEIRRVMPTAAGLPMELAFYTVAVTAANVQARFQANLPQNFHVSDLLKQKTNIEADIKPSMALNTFAVMGMNTDIVQAAIVSRAKVQVNVPAKIAASLDLAENNFKISALPVRLSENVAVAVDVDTLAIARQAKRVTPLIPEDASPQASSETSSSASASNSREILGNMQQVQDRPLPTTRVPRSDKKFCTVTAGVKICINISSSNAKFITDSALSRLAGKHAVLVSVEQSESDNVEKWEMELQLGAKAANKLIKNINLDMDEVLEGTPILSKLKRILNPSMKNNTSSSSSSSSRSRVRSSHPSSSSSSSSSSSKSHMAGKVISTMGKIIGVNQKRSSSSSSSSSRSQQNRKRQRSTVSSLSSLFSASSSSSQFFPKSQRQSSRSKFQPNHQKTTSKRHSGSASSARTFEDIRKQNKFLGNTVEPVFALILRAVRANNNNPLGYQIAAYKDGDRVQMIMAALASHDNWRLCADAIKLSKNKAAAKIAWGEKCQKYETMITAESGRVQNKGQSQDAARVRVAWKRLPTAVVKDVKMIYNSIIAPYLSSGYLQKRSDATRQISFTVVVESKKQLGFIWKSPAFVYRSNVPLPITLPIDELKEVLPFDEMLDNAHYLLAKTTGIQCRFNEGQLTTFSKRQYKNYMPNSCYQLLAQDCTDELKFIVLLKKDSAGRYMVNVKIGTRDIDMFFNGERPAVMINGKEIARERLPYDRDSVTILLMNGKLFLRALDFGIAELQFSASEVTINVPEYLRNKVCGLCGQGNGDRRNDYRMPNGRITDNPISFAHSWTLPSQSCSDETECRLTHESIELEREINDHGVPSKCFSVDSVLRCRPGCTPTKTTMSSVSFHCRPLNDNSQVSDIRNRSIDMTESVEAHLDCSCTSQCA